MSLISRRSLLTSGAAAGVLAASGLGVAAATPKMGGTLKAVLSGGRASDTWDTRQHDSLFMIAAAHGAVFDCLTEIGPDGALRGELAESWSATADAKVWTFTLRKGVTFHNGKPFVSDDVLESFSLHIGAVGTSPVEPLLRDVTRLRALNAHQVEFTLAAPNADFPYLLSDYHLVIYPAGYVELAMENGIGTGLYKVAHFEPGVRLDAERVPAHYKDGQAGFFEKISLETIAAPTERLNRFLNADVDVIGQVAPGYAPQLSEKADVALQTLQGNQHYSFALGPDVSWTDSERVVQAVKLGVDRAEIIEGALLGHGRLGTDTPIGPANPYFASTLNAPRFDPEQAKHLLRQAQVDRVTLQVSSAAGVQSSDLLAQFRRQMAQIGLSVDLAKGPADMSLNSHAGRATEDWAMSTYLAPGGMWNTSNWEDAQCNALVAAARSEMDTAKRRALYQALQDVVQQKGRFVVPAFLHHIQAHRSTIATPNKVGVQFGLDNARFAERWWHV